MDSVLFAVATVAAFVMIVVSPITVLIAGPIMVYWAYKLHLKGFE